VFGVLSHKSIKNTRGLTLVEVVIAMLIITIAALGVSSFRYQAALDARRADAQIVASRTGLLLGEGWRGLRGATTYDPVADLSSELTIATSTDGPTAPSGFTEIGKYHIVASRANYYATLSWNDISAGLRALNVSVAWEQRGKETDYDDTDKVFSLTTYTNY
jgi:prepilin-type N-terminal cleavage/methylation domain-containing protein